MRRGKNVVFSCQIKRSQDAVVVVMRHLYDVAYKTGTPPPSRGVASEPAVPDELSLGTISSGTKLKYNEVSTARMVAAVVPTGEINNSFLSRPGTKVVRLFSLEFLLPETLSVVSWVGRGTDALHVFLHRDHGISTAESRPQCHGKKTGDEPQPQASHR